MQAEFYLSALYIVSGSRAPVFPLPLWLPAASHLDPHEDLALSGLPIPPCVCQARAYEVVLQPPRDPGLSWAAAIYLWVLSRFVE